MKEKHANAFMNAAYIFAHLSYCQRRQVGCLIVKDDRIISIGYNGCPPGWPNVCEDADGNTKPEVSHAEENAIKKLAASNESGRASSMFVTTAPCLPCAKLIAGTGIKEVFYSDEYRGTQGLEYLAKCGIPVYRMSIPVVTSLKFKIRRWFKWFFWRK